MRIICLILKCGYKLRLQTLTHTLLPLPAHPTLLHLSSADSHTELYTDNLDICKTVLFKSGLLPLFSIQFSAIDFAVQWSLAMSTRVQI
jgi:hypothetical protein